MVRPTSTLNAEMVRERRAAKDLGSTVLVPHAGLTRPLSWNAEGIDLPILDTGRIAKPARDRPQPPRFTQPSIRRSTGSMFVYRRLGIRARSSRRRP